MSKASKGIFAKTGNGEGRVLPPTALATPGFEIGISAPTTEVDEPGPEIGISAPTTDDAAPAGDAPAGDDTSSGDAGDSLRGLGDLGIRSSNSTIAGRADDEDTNQKGGGAGFDPTACQPGKRKYRPASDARHQSGRKPLLLGQPQRRRHPDRLQVGHPEPHLQLPDVGLELQRHRPSTANGVSLYHIDLGAAAAGGGARGLRPDLGGDRA